MPYYRRVIEDKIKEYLTIFPVVGLTGPRQSGKSTTLKNILKNYRYVTFDDFQTREFFLNDPNGFIKQYKNKVIFDEVQKVPELFNLVKLEIDKDRENYGKYVLTGSSQFAMLQKITESLAGRIGLLSLLPIQFIEAPKNTRKDLVYKGCYPELIKRRYTGSEDWYSAYLNTYLEKDVRDMSQVGSLRDFCRLIELLAANTSQIINHSNYARDIGVTVQTIKRWISILEASYIIFLLPPFYKNYGKRIVKSSKLYFWDTGLVAYLTGIKTEELYDKGPMAGAIFENFVISEIFKIQHHNKTHARLYYFRSNNKEEVDLIVDNKTSKNFIEIKKTSTFRPQMVKFLSSLLQDKQDCGYLLFQGKEFLYKDNVKVIPYSQFLMEKQIPY